MHRLFQRSKDEDGAAAVEFALIAGVLAMLIFGMLQFGIAFFEVQNLRSATREGARLGAVGATEDVIRTRVENASYGSIPAASTVMSVDLCDEDESNLSDTSKVMIDIDPSNAALPARLRDIFSLDIPFMPPISIDTIVEGEFRCEGEF